MGEDEEYQEEKLLKAVSPLTFHVVSLDADEGKEDFIAAAAIPISCMRQGYRSIPLFDANHMRCGSHGSTMLLARIDARQWVLVDDSFKIVYNFNDVNHAL